MASPTTRLALGLAGIMVLSGCVDGGGGVVEDDRTTTVLAELPWNVRPLVYDQDHEHRDQYSHLNVSSRNMDVLGWTPFSSPYYEGFTMPGYSCTSRDPQTRDDGRRYVYTVSLESDVAFITVDVTDPENPFWVSEYILPEAHMDDIAVTEDGKYVILGSEFNKGAEGPGDPLQALPAIRNELGLEDLKTGLPAGSVVTNRPDCPGGVIAPPEDVPPQDHFYVIDVSDPYEPRYVTSTKMLHAFGPHNLITGDIDGRTYVFGFTLGIAPNPLYPTPSGASYFGGPVVGRVYIYELTTDALGGPSLQLTTTWNHVPWTDGIPDPTAMQFPHDGYLEVHPVTGENLLYLPMWDDGLVIVNVDDPRVPLEVGRWTDHAFLDHFEASGNIHHVRTSKTLWDDRHYTIIGPENPNRPPEGQPTAWTYILDTTDPTNPIYVSKWRLPVEPQPGWTHMFQFSPHFLRVVDRTLYMAHFHAGAWVFDLSTPEKIEAFEPVGMFLPDRVPDKVYEGRRLLPSLPLVVDIEADEQALYVSDWQSGVYVVKLDPSRAP